MSVDLDVSSLSGEIHLLKGELDWTGRQIKEALEVQTNFQMLAPRQRLYVDGMILEDVVRLSDFLGESKAVQKVNLSLLLVDDARAWSSCEDQSKFAQLLRTFKESSVWLQWPHYNLLFDANCHVKRKRQLPRRQGQDGLPRDSLWLEAHEISSEQKPVEEDSWWHVPLDNATLMQLMPWQCLGVAPDEVAGVLTLHGSWEMIGDGESWVAGILVLKDSTLLAITVNIREYESSIRAPLACSSTCQAQSLDDLRSKIPQFVSACQEGVPDIFDSELKRDPIGPRHVMLGPNLPWQFWSDFQAKQQADEKIEIDPVSPHIEMPLRKFCKYPYLGVPSIMHHVFQQITDNLQVQGYDEYFRMIIERAAEEQQLQIERKPLAGIIAKLRDFDPDDPYLASYISSLAESAPLEMLLDDKELIQLASKSVESMGVRVYGDLAFAGEHIVEFETWHSQFEGW